LFSGTVSDSDNMASSGRIISQHSIENDLKEAVVENLTSLHIVCQERLKILVISQSGYTVLELSFGRWTFRL
jgi:hypothetical protein